MNALSWIGELMSTAIIETLKRYRNDHARKKDQYASSLILSTMAKSVLCMVVSFLYFSKPGHLIVVRVY